VQITHRKRLPWCKLINSYNFFFIVNVFHHKSRKTFRRNVEAPGKTLQVKPASRKLQRSRLGLGSEGLVHIPACGWCYSAVLLTYLLSSAVTDKYTNKHNALYSKQTAHRQCRLYSELQNRLKFIHETGKNNP